MKPHPRIRKTVKWGGAVATVLFLTIWISSRWWYVEYMSQGGAWVGVGEGTVGIGHVWGDTGISPSPLPHWYGFLDPPHLAWWFDWRSQPPWRWWVSVPLWVPTVPLLIVTGAAWRLDALARRRAGAGHCAKCGYDLRGLREGAVCPECGGAAVVAAAVYAPVARGSAHWWWVGFRAFRVMDARGQPQSVPHPSLAVWKRWARGPTPQRAVRYAREILWQERLSHSRLFAVLLWGGSLFFTVKACADLVAGLSQSNAAWWDVACGWLVAALMLTFAVLRQKLFDYHLRRLRAGAADLPPMCAKCGYELVGLTPAPDGCTVCPECGSAWRLSTPTAACASPR